MRQLLVAIVLLACGMFATFSIQAAALPAYFEKTGNGFVYRSTSNVAFFDVRGVTWGTGDSTLRMSFIDADATAIPEGEEKPSGRISYLIGSADHWHRTEAYAEIHYREMYPGISLNFHRVSAELEYNFHIAPFADPSAIRVRFAGRVQAHLDRSGDLLAGTLRHHKPLAYQTIQGKRQSVSASFFLTPDGEVRFRLGKYDHSAALIVDPVVTYDKSITGTGSVNIVAMTVDAQGNVYVAGETSATDLPITPGAMPPATAPSLPIVAPQRMFVAKLNPEGKDFTYLTYVGGSGNDFARGIALDASGNLYVAGSTASKDFPTTDKAFQKNLIVSSCTSPPAEITPMTYPCNDGFVLKLNPTGTALIYSTLLGGSGDDELQGVRIDLQGDAWVAGYTTSADFPTTAGAFQTKLNGTSDGVIALLNPTGTALLQSTLLGGKGADQINALTLDPAGNLYVAGATTSDDFPVTTGVLQTTFSGITNAFVAKFGPGSSKPLYATYYSGPGGLAISDIQVDVLGNAYLAFASVPLTASPPAVRMSPASGTPGATIIKIDPQASSVLFQNNLLYMATSLSVDAEGQIIALGTARPSPLGNLPISPNALVTCATPFSPFLLRFAADGQTIRYGSYVGSGPVPFVFSPFPNGISATGNSFSAGWFSTVDIFSGAVLAADVSNGVYLATGSNIEKQDFSHDTPMAATCVIPYAESTADAISPGEIISIYGRNLGPVVGVQGVYDSSLQLPFTLGGVTVTFDGTPAPVWYAQAGQVNTVVPFATVNQTSTKIEITYNGASATIVQPMRQASNIILQLNNRIAAINEDGTINSSDHPAAPGSVVSIFSDGGGQTDPPLMDGQIAKTAAPLLLPAHVFMGFQGGGQPISADVLYSGAAPNLLAGVIQINFRVPTNLPPGSASPGFPNQPVALGIGNQWAFGSGGGGSIFVSQQ